MADQQYFISARLTFSYDHPDTARKLLASFEPDNDGYIISRLQENSILSEAENDSILGMRATIDDLLACLTTSEKVMKL